MIHLVSRPQLLILCLKKKENLKKGEESDGRDQVAGTKHVQASGKVCKHLVADAPASDDSLAIPGLPYLEFSGGGRGPTGISKQ